MYENFDMIAYSLQKKPNSADIFNDKLRLEVDADTPILLPDGLPPLR